MKIAVIGTGYVGLVAGVCFADAGHSVICVDKNAEKIAMLKEGKIPIYEPGLEELAHESRARLEYTTDLPAAVQACSVVFIAVQTPEMEDGSADLRPTMAVVDAISKAANGKKYVVMKSTVPVGTSKLVKERFAKANSHPVEVVSNPEFLKEGAAIDDFLRPDRVVIGCGSADAEAVMRELYDPFVKNGNPILIMDNTSAEMTKYAANAFLSVKISFINELALLSDALGADINQVRKGFTSDKRINPAFFYPGVGFGGSCFPKDVKALVHTGRANGVPMDVVHAADEVNDRQKLILFDRMKRHFGDLRGKTIAVWGLAFKPRTDDVREAPALYLIEKLIESGARVRAYDPAAMETATAASRVKFDRAETAQAAVEGADALAIITEWNEFRTVDLDVLKTQLKQPVIFDGRNVLDPVKAAQAGFKYYCIGRQIMGTQDAERA
jgi:UDPglucose 6-dehydrogenase